MEVSGDRGTDEGMSHVKSCARGPQKKDSLIFQVSSLFRRFFSGESLESG